MARCEMVVSEKVDGTVVYCTQPAARKCDDCGGAFCIKHTRVLKNEGTVCTACTENQKTEEGAEGSSGTHRSRLGILATVAFIAVWTVGGFFKAAQEASSQASVPAFIGNVAIPIALLVALGFLLLAYARDW
jgi:hypothetical protein